ncbi:uncharacterized protein LOC142350388 [Convolutriloba macropyga]|uniref:uncharacterized protein LOC142350388 n=1 Tax=Convolutriloba macropyga TaxID=536237 RepID=UPI003F52644B
MIITVNFTDMNITSEDEGGGGVNGSGGAGLWQGSGPIGCSVGWLAFGVGMSLVFWGIVRRRNRYSVKEDFDYKWRNREVYDDNCYVTNNFNTALSSHIPTEATFGSCHVSNKGGHCSVTNTGVRSLYARFYNQASIDKEQDSQTNINAIDNDSAYHTDPINQPGTFDEGPEPEPDYSSSMDDPQLDEPVEDSEPQQVSSENRVMSSAQRLVEANDRIAETGFAGTSSGGGVGEDHNNNVNELQDDESKKEEFTDEDDQAQLCEDSEVSGSLRREDTVEDTITDYNGSVRSDQSLPTDATNMSL